MLIKVLLLGHVLLASAFERKALRELQVDVDTLEKSLMSGSELSSLTADLESSPIDMSDQ